MIPEIHLNSWEDVHSHLFDYPEDPKHGHFRSPYAFRGLAQRHWHLDTGLRRLGGPYERLEQHLLRSFEKYAHVELMSHYGDVMSGSVAPTSAAGGEVTLRSGVSTWHMLSMAQHYGLPTRLLDWTYSPYVALHFATVEPESADEDGVVWAVDIGQVNTFLSDNLQQVLSSREAWVYTVGMLDSVVPSLQALDTYTTPPLMVFFEPPSLDARIVNQFALFSVISDPTARTDEWLDRIPGLATKYVVPAERKREFRDKLDAANITERMLFPGLDGLTAWLKRWYSP